MVGTSRAALTGLRGRPTHPLVLAIGLGFGLFLPLLVNPVRVSAQNYTSPPTYAHSYYLSNPSGGVMDAIGYQDGSRDNAACQVGHVVDSIAILDFGEIAQMGSSYGGYGTYMFDQNITYHPLDDMGGAVNNYVAGWWRATSACPHLHVVVGVHSKLECYRSQPGCGTYQFGQNLGTIVNGMQGFVNSQHFQAQVSIWAGFDVEVGYDCPGRAMQVSAGFNANNPAVAEMIDFGDAGYNQTCLQAPAEANWTTQQILQVAYLDTANWPLPESYYQTAIDQWAAIDKYVGHMYFRGALSTTAGNSPDGAWYALWNTLINTGQPQSELNYSTYLTFR